MDLIRVFSSLESAFFHIYNTLLNEYSFLHSIVSYWTLNTSRYNSKYFCFLSILNRTVGQKKKAVQISNPPPHQIHLGWHLSCMFKKSCPIVLAYLQYINEQDLLDIQYISESGGSGWVVATFQKCGTGCAYKSVSNVFIVCTVSPRSLVHDLS